MKIAFVVEEFPKISETFVLNQATGLIDMGHEVDIFYFNLGDTKVMHSDIQKYGLLEKAVCLDPLYVYSDRIGITREAFNKKFSKKIGFKLPSLKLSRYVRSLLSVLILLKFRFSRMKDEKYDIIHCQFGTVALRFLPFCRLRILGGKFIVQFRGYDLTEFVKQKGDKVYRKLFREADYFLPVCEYLREQAVLIGCPEDKISVLRSGIDCERFTFSKRKKPTKGPIKIAFVGRLVDKKGSEYAIKAMVILKQRGYKAKLMIVGDGPLEQSLRRLCRDLNIQNHVTFFGAKNHDQVVEIINSAHLFIAPSVTSRTGDQEGMPDVLKEAMAMGLPVVSTYHAGIPELVQDGVSGFLVPERDEQALADRLGYLIDHPKRWGEMGRAGRQFVEKNYDKERLNRELVDIYHCLVG